MNYDALDDFAGPGGWDEGARMVGLTTLGVEWDAAACATAEAAGHAREQADVSLHPTEPLIWVKGRGYIASPPCTLFSSAGSGVGNLVIDVLANGIRRMFDGEDCREDVRARIFPVTLAEAQKKNDKRADGKKWTCEKVKEKALADAFVASLVLEPARRIVALQPAWVALEQVPEVLPVWQVYVRELQWRGYSAWTGVLNAANYGVPQTRERAVVMASLVGKVAPPVPTHSPTGDDGDLFGETRERWVTMADALGWDDPAFVKRERSGDRSDEGFDPHVIPAQCLTSKSRSWEVMLDRRQAGAPVVNASKRPSPAITSAMFGKGVAKVWWQERPATTVVGSFKPEVISAPGYRTETSRQNAEGSIVVTVNEAGVLQSFPPDYPWQGSRSKQFQQVGNAVPPLLAAHVLAVLTGKALEVAA